MKTNERRKPESHWLRSSCFIKLKKAEKNYRGKNKSKREYGQMLKLSIDKDRLREFCRRYHIRRLALFGSALRSDFRHESDVDVLVEFEPGHVPGLFGIARMERKLSNLFGGRKVDLRTPEDLSRYFRKEVLESAEVQYEQGR